MDSSESARVEESTRESVASWLFSRGCMIQELYGDRKKETQGKRDWQRRGDQPPMYLEVGASPGLSGVSVKVSRKEDVGWECRTGRTTPQSLVGELEGAARESVRAKHVGGMRERSIVSKGGGGAPPAPCR